MGALKLAARIAKADGWGIDLDRAQIRHMAETIAFAEMGGRAPEPEPVDVEGPK